MTDKDQSELREYLKQFSRKQLVDEVLRLKSKCDYLKTYQTQCRRQNANIAEYERLLEEMQNKLDFRDVRINMLLSLADQQEVMIEDYKSRLSLCQMRMAGALDED